jgi:hypothetical protein
MMPSTGATVRDRSSALLFRAGGPQVAVIGGNGTVKFLPNFLSIGMLEANGTFGQRRCLPSTAALQGKYAMTLRAKTTTKGPDPEEPSQELFSQRRKPEVAQFHLQVDRQTKGSFPTLTGLVSPASRPRRCATSCATYEAAEAAGMEIKRGHPIVRVAVCDALECINRIIESHLQNCGSALNYWL